MSVQWTAEAEAELAQAQDYGRLHYPGQVELMTLAILRGVARLREFPELGRTGQVVGTRELVIGHYPFLLIYTEHAGMVVVLRLLHQTRRWPTGGGA